jgi:ABC-type uncharacterized transport system permease subunit
MASPTDLVTDAYAGALLFVAFLAEMRNPMDFWKGLFCAQAFICIVYLLFGNFNPCRARISSLITIFRNLRLLLLGPVLREQHCQRH